MPWHVQVSIGNGWETDPTPIATLEDAYLIAAAETDESDSAYAQAARVVPASDAQYTAALHFGSQEAAEEARVRLAATIEVVRDRSLIEIVRA